MLSTLHPFGKFTSVLKINAGFFFLHQFCNLPAGHNDHILGNLGHFFYTQVHQSSQNRLKKKVIKLNLKCLNISSLLLINQKPYSKYGKTTTIYNNYKQIVNALLTSLAWNNFVMAKKVSVASVDPICSPYKITIKNRLDA